MLTYGTDGNGNQTGFFIYDVWDPSAGTTGGGHLTLPNITGTDIFCSSQVILPQSGNIFLAGGDNYVNGGTTNTGNNNSNVFNPPTNSLARGNNINRPRWYSTSTTLLNGEIYIQGGNGGGDLPEIRDTDGGLRLLSNVNTSGYSATFPRNFLAPDGRVFGFDTSGKMYYVSPAGTGLLHARRPVARRHQLDLERRDVPAGTHPADGRRVECRAGHRHQWRAAGRDVHAVDVDAAPVGVRHRAAGRPGARHRRQRGREPAHRREQQSPRSGTPPRAPGRREPRPSMRACITRSRCCCPMPPC